MRTSVAERRCARRCCSSPARAWFSLPATLHNRIAGGEWILTTSNAGQNFYIGNNPLNSSGEYQWLPFVDPNPKYEERDFAREAERRSGRKLGAAQTSRFWFSAALSWIRKEPAAWLRLSWRKLAAYWGAYEIPDNLDFYLYREGAPVLRLPRARFRPGRATRPARSAVGLATARLAAIADPLRGALLAVGRVVLCLLSLSHGDEAGSVRVCRVRRRGAGAPSARRNRSRSASSGR